ncbi:MAG: ABC transporter ATP-binding protein [Candidatus Micrarchaeota archaeon]|nr:ABC transporter ATP-binding protein [Candidatus Micrarchaeota archaeon]
MYAIEAKDIVKTYSEKVTLYDFSIKIPMGTIYGLLGPNGAGKSTFIRIIDGLEKQNSGVLKIFGESPNKRLRKQLGIAPQENSFHGLLTCFENLMYYAELYGVNRGEAKQRAEDLLKRLGLGEKMHARASWLSGGMKRRLNLACGLMHKPKIIIMDEPTTGLDPVSRNQMWNVVRDIQKKEKVTIILTTHYMEEAELLCDEISFINRGHVVVTGTPEKLKEIAGKEFLRIRSRPGEYLKFIKMIQDMEGIESATISDGEILIEAKNLPSKISSVTRLLDDQGEKILDLRISKATLEDAFIKLTGSALKEDKTAHGEKKLKVTPK